MSEKIPDLSKAEWAVMKAVWALGKTTAREVHDELGDEREWAYNTVRTMMERLAEKGYLATKRVGRTNFYTPLVSRRRAATRALGRFVDRVYDGAVGPAICHLIKNENLTDAEIEEIKQLLGEGGEK